jgi:hypothetical protein
MNSVVRASAIPVAGCLLSSESLHFFNMFSGSFLCQWTLSSIGNVFLMQMRFAYEQVLGVSGGKGWGWSSRKVRRLCAKIDITHTHNNSQLDLLRAHLQITTQMYGRRISRSRPWLCVSRRAQMSMHCRALTLTSRRLFYGGSTHRPSTMGMYHGCSSVITQKHQPLRSECTLCHSTCAFGESRRLVRNSIPAVSSKRCYAVCPIQESDSYKNTSDLR